MPRVITGRFRGTVLFAPEGDKTRPTTDKVKEALFSIIQNNVPGSEFLDLFAGSGQIGIEAVSRGAVRATLIDKGGDPARIISKNLEKIRMKDSPEIRFIKEGFTQALEKLGSNEEKFDIIFMDPPYKSVPEAALAAGEIISRLGMLKEGGMLIIEHASSNPPAECLADLKSVRSCSYGTTVITFFKIRSEER